MWDVRAAAATGHHLAGFTDEIRLRFFSSVCGEAGTAWDTCLPCDSSECVHESPVMWLDPSRVS